MHWNGKTLRTKCEAALENRRFWEWWGCWRLTLNPWGNKLGFKQCSNTITKASLTDAPLPQLVDWSSKIVNEKQIRFPGSRALKISWLTSTWKDETRKEDWFWSGAPEQRGNLGQTIHRSGVSSQSRKNLVTAICACCSDLQPLTRPVFANPPTHCINERLGAPSKEIYFHFPINKVCVRCLDPNCNPTALENVNWTGYLGRQKWIGSYAQVEKGQKTSSMELGLARTRPPNEIALLLKS